MANNPIFPFYVNDFEGGTRHMTDAEVGCYMRLLMAQFNRGGQLPSDLNLLRRYCTSFDESWPIVSEKFLKINGSKLQNKRLEIERVKRESFVESRSKNKLGKTKSHEDHTKITTKSSENHLGKGKGKGNGYGKEEGKLEGGSGEEKLIVPQMCQVWYQNFPTYTADRENDFEGMGKMLQFIYRQAGNPKDIQVADTQIKILNTVQFIADQVNRDPFWVNKPIKSVANNIQEFYNKIKNPIDGKQTKQSTPDAKSIVEETIRIREQRRAARQQTGN